MTITTVTDRELELERLVAELEAKLKAEQEAHEAWQQQHLIADGGQCRCIRELEAKLAEQTAIIEQRNAMVSREFQDAQRYRWLKANPYWIWDNDLLPEDVETELNRAMRGEA